MMRSTITAKIGYRVKHVVNVITGELALMVYDGNQPIMVAHAATIEEYTDNRENNEAFWLCEIFKTVKGNTFACWRDEETGIDYITKIGAEQ